MKKRTMATMMGLALTVATIAPLTVSAATPGVQAGSKEWSTTGNSESDFSLSLKYMESLKPSYTVTVPQSLQMQEDGTDVWVQVSNMKNVEANGKYVSVKVRDTYANKFPSAYKDADHMYMLYSGYNFMKFTVQAKNEDGTYDEALTAFDQELLAFTEDGTQYYRVTPDDDSATAESATWFGAINFTVGLEDIPTSEG